MPINVEWINESQTILLTTFEGEWDLEEFYHMTGVALSLLKDIDHHFVGVIDYTNSTTPPRRTLNIGRHVERIRNPYRIKIIFVNPGFLVERLYGILGRLYTRGFGSYRTATSLEEAYAMAEEVLKSAKNGH